MKNKQQTKLTVCDKASLYILSEICRLRSNRYTCEDNVNAGIDKYIREVDINKKMRQLIQKRGVIACVDLSPQAVHASLSKFCTLGIVTTQSTIRADGTAAQYAFRTNITYENCIEANDFFCNLVSEHYYYKHFNLFTSKDTKKAYKRLLHIATHSSSTETICKQRIERV